MRPQVTLSEDGYTISGIEPSGLTPAQRKLFYTWVVTFGLKEKDRDLAKGLDKDGMPFHPISEETRKHRRSAMTPSGKGDPDAPPLIPGWQKSRTRSLLKGRAYADRAEFWWAYDAFTGDSWARILEAQRSQGRDAFGLGPAALKRVQQAAMRRWEAYRGGQFKPKPEPTVLAPPKRERPRVIDLTPDAIGMSGPIKDRSGFMTIDKLNAFYRQTAPARLQGRPLRPKIMSGISGPRYNRLLSHVHQPKIAAGK